MDFKVQITYTMMAAVAAGQLTSYVCLHTFPAHWGIAPDRALGQDQARIVLVRMGTTGTRSRTPAVTGDGRTATLNRGGQAQPQPTAKQCCRCERTTGTTPVMNRDRTCSKCDRRVDTGRGLASYSMPETYEVHGMDAHRMLPFPANPLADTNVHFNFVASFCTHMLLVYALQLIKRSPMRMDSIWMAIFVSAIIALLYTLLASNNNSWKHRSFTTASLLTLHKFIILLAINSVLTFNKQLDTLF